METATKWKTLQAIDDMNKCLLAYVAQGLALMFTFNSLHFPMSLPKIVFCNKEEGPKKLLYETLHQVYYHNLAIFLKLIYKKVKLGAPEDPLAAICRQSFTG